MAINTKRVLTLKGYCELINIIIENSMETVNLYNFPWWNNYLTISSKHKIKFFKFVVCYLFSS